MTREASATSWLARAARTGLDALLPPRCLGCGTVVETQGTLCGPCWSRIGFLGPPQCARCGLPFEFEDEAASTCAGCIAVPPPFGRARSALAYDDGSRSLVLSFKHGDRTFAAGPFAGWMARAGAELLGDATLLAAVPLHRWRLFRRRYNQAALLALEIGRRSGIAAVPDLLVRRRATPSQGGLSRSGRRRNVNGAFAVHPGRAERVRGARIVLVDDVFTTGATVEACARALMRAGAERVDVLTLARVVRPRA